MTPRLGKFNGTYAQMLLAPLCLLALCRTRHVPKPVYKAAQLKRTVLEARRVKEDRRRKHTRAGESKPKADRKKVVIAEQS